MKKNNWNIYISVLGLVIAGLFVVYYFLYGYIYALGQHTADLSQKIQQQSTQGQEIKNSINSLNQITPQITTIDSYLIGPDGEVGFIDDLENRAKAYNLNVAISSVNIVSTPELSTKGLEYLSLKFSIKGSWSNVYRFISLVPNLPFLITVNQADLTSLPDVGNSVWQSDLVILVLKKSK